MEYFIVFLFIFLAIALVGGGLGASRLLAPRHPTVLKESPYECGEKPIGSAWIQFNVGFYLFALLFLVFDVEAAFLFPWAVVFRELGFIGLFEVGIFLLVLIMGLVYAWKKGVLEWV